MPQMLLKFNHSDDGSSNGNRDGEDGSDLEEVVIMDRTEVRAACRARKRAGWKQAVM